MSTPRYRLHVYLCGRSCIRQSPLEGWVTFEDVFHARPDQCRYAVAETVQGTFLVWDMYDSRVWPTSRSTLSPELIVLAAATPDPIDTGDSLDALIMKTMVRYERD